VIDRRTVEELFGVKKRRANELIQVFGEFQTANVYLVTRESLIAALHRIREADEIRYELARRKRLSADLVRLDRHARARAIRLPVRTVATAALPSGVFVSPGALTVRYHSAEDLFGKLYGIAELAAVDFERMRQTLAPYGVGGVCSGTEMMDSGT
jgi:hypothetical protein